MAGAFNPASRATPAGGRARLPGHFVVLTNDSRIDAVLAQGGVRLADALERRAAINVNNVLLGPNDGSRPLTPAPSIKSVDPRTVIIAMPAEDGDPVVSEAEHEAWHEWRVTYVVTLEATPFKVAGTLLLLPSQDPFLLTELGTTLFLPVFSPTVEVGEVTLTDLRHDAILVNRSHLRRVRNATRH
jgi:hypothetical protein